MYGVKMEDFQNEFHRDFARSANSRKRKEKIHMITCSFIKVVVIVTCCSAFLCEFLAILSRYKAKDTLFSSKETL